MPDGSKSMLRRTLEGLFVRESRGELIIGAHWSTKAAAEGEGNLTTVAGEWFREESLEDAMKRLAGEEYGLEGTIEVISLKHRQFISPERRKEYYWALVRYGGSLEILPNECHVASFGWYDGPAALRTLISQMHADKAYMFQTVLGLAMEIEPRLARYKSVVLLPPKPKRHRK